MEKQENIAARSERRPPCHRTVEFKQLWEAVVKTAVIEGHFAVLPITIYHNGSILRSGDPIPLHAQNSRTAAIDCLKHLAATLQAEHLDWRRSLPRILFSESGATLHTIQNLVQQLCRVAYVEIVDKHSSAMWAFYRQWA